MANQDSPDTARRGHVLRDMAHVDEAGRALRAPGEGAAAAKDGTGAFAQLGRARAMGWQ
ncbi:MAG: hypothetical protein HYZ20_02145 [Burkholderiales bacterium]|nr:hypothetical protein [Burkholderiales bacterium]